MILVTVYKQSNYPVNARKVGKAVKETLKKQGIVSDSEVSVALLGREEVAKLAKKHLEEPINIAKDHPVLSFLSSEVERFFVFPPDGKIHLGEIVISYHQALETAKKTGRLLDEVVVELAVHGATHLVGIHHE